jgi:hypothetical protein
MLTDSIRSSRPVKIGVIIVSSLASLYLLGHEVRISTLMVRGYKKMTSTIKQ